MSIGDKQIQAIDNVKKYLNNLKNSDRFLLLCYPRMINASFSKIL